MKALVIFYFKLHTAKKALRKKSIMDMHIFHVLVLGFVNAFGYMLPTLYMFKNSSITIFEYLFQSFYVDLVFTVIISLIMIRRPELHTFKVLLPIALSIFGMAFHYLVTVSQAKYAGSTLVLLKFNISVPARTVPDYNT